MYLTVEFDVGFGTDKDESDRVGIGMGKSLGPLTLLVKRFIGWEGSGETRDDGQGEQEVMNIDS